MLARDIVQTYSVNMNINVFLNHTDESQQYPEYRIGRMTVYQLIVPEKENPNQQVFLFSIEGDRILNF